MLRRGLPLRLQVFATAPVFPGFATCSIRRVGADAATAIATFVPLHASSVRQQSESATSGPSSHSFAEALARDDAREAQHAATRKPSTSSASSDDDGFPLNQHDTAGPSGFHRQRWAPGTPLKDRLPPKQYRATNQSSPRLAILVDANKVSAASFATLLEKGFPRMDAIARGTTLLVRVFDFELKPDWQQLILTKSSPLNPTATNPTTAAAGDVIDRWATYEWFRVERFIPVTMQMEADARHIAYNHKDNLLEGIVYVCTHAECPLFEVYLDRPKRMQDLPQWLISDELINKPFTMRSVS